MTVSLSLRGHPDAAPTTRERIRLLAQEMGYRPNPLIVANMAQLRAGRREAFAGTIAFAGIGESPHRENPPNTQNVRIFGGAQRRAEALGYRIEWFPLHTPALDGRRLTEIIKARGILGVVLGANQLVEPLWHFEWSQFAIAAIGRTEIAQEVHRTVGDYYRAVREAYQRCRARGYRRIGLAVSREHDFAHQNLHRSAFLGAQADWPQADYVPPLVATEWKPGPFFEWVKQHQPEVVIACYDDPIFWIRDAGLRIPEDIGLIRPHVNDHALNVAGFLFDDAGLGAAAIDLVVEQLNHNERGIPDVVKRVLLPGRWTEGKSLRPAPAAVETSSPLLSEKFSCAHLPLS